MKIICIGRNYAAHAAELNNPIPETPLIFMKPDTAVLKDGKAFYHPDFSNDIHHEIELVLRISKSGKKIEPEFAHKYYDQITVGIDLTARDLQSKCKEKGHPWEIAKAFDHSAVLGEFIPLSELKNENGHYDFSMTKNGQTVQKGNIQALGEAKKLFHHFSCIQLPLVIISDKMAESVELISF
jgi:2-keto-4-pentenoate hydratase/2-oxohepta-3-ene-1,7-dioic acid hydratase in catechol pathway